MKNVSNDRLIIREFLLYAATLQKYRMKSANLRKRFGITALTMEIWTLYFTEFIPSFEESLQTKNIEEIMNCCRGILICVALFLRSNFFKLILTF